MGGATYDCLKMLKTISVDDDKNKDICKLWKFSNLEHMRLWYGAMYYGSQSR